MFGNLRTFSENFGNGSKVIFRWFYFFFKFSENLRKSSEVFGKLRKRFKSNLRMFLWCFKIFGKSSEVFGNLAIFSLVKIWKISYSGPGCPVIWILWVVYFPVKHCCPYSKYLLFSITWKINKNNLVHWMLDFLVFKERCEHFHSRCRWYNLLFLKRSSS